MNDIAEERPDFFEGEYLGADDLKQLVVYMRDQSARHALGGHAWGIAAGLDLIEQPSPSGSGRDVYLLPGYAIDGYGRAVIVVNPVRFTVDRFDGQPAGLVPVWLYYVEGQSRNVRPGFEVCNASDTFSRVGESYEIAVGLFQDLTKRQSGILVGGETVPDAREALRVFDDKGPIACDASVPYQDLPLGDPKSRWLIPLGLVNWQPGPPGSFLPLADDPDRLRSRQLRRYLGVVAESVLAADGLIRLRRRTTPWPTTGTPSTDDLCFADDLANPKHDHDLNICHGRAEFNELVWVEGRMRITDDTRLLDGRLEFRDRGGTNYWPEFQPGSPALLFERADNGNHADLRLLIGRTLPTDKQRNNFIIASGAPQAPDPAKPCDKLVIKPSTLVTVQDDGKVGIGAHPPDQMLNVQGDDNVFVHVVATSGNDLFVGATKDASVIAAGNDLRIRTGNGADPGGGSDPTKDTTTHVFVKSSGLVGIGTIDPGPGRLLTLEQQSATYLGARTIDGPHEALLGADDKGAVVAGTKPTDDLRLGAGGSDKMWIKPDGKVGIGTDSPGRDLTAQGGAGTYINARNQTGKEILIGADWTGTMVSAMSNDDLQLRAGMNQNRVMIKAGGNVGIGTDAPAEVLDVRGNIRVGNGDLFVPGSPNNLRIITGNIGAAGNIIAGNGFTCTPLIGSGHYLITLLAPFLAPPVVVASVSASADDDMASLAHVLAGSFEIIVYDTSLHHRESNPFSFVAFGLR